MSDLTARRFGGSDLERLTHAVESAARTGIVDAQFAQAAREAASGRGRVARLAGAVTDLLQALARTQEREHHRTCSAIQSLREPLTAIKAHVQVLGQHPDLPTAARTALLTDLDAEVACLCEELDALAAAVRKPVRPDQGR
ncbi:hypothetical protein [Streptacidiphilus cavernicola]|uniref:Uncharacterized protein n=1 Tax=Streptacidiphilus cavernicola TaxID=3342716 RepID=A0ABV6VVE7_9ACTN